MTGQPGLHAEALPPRQIEALRKLGPTARAEGFHLAGGTALAIQLGHRQSVDLDWFCSELTDPEALAARLYRALPAFELRQTARGTLHGSILGVATSFLAYPYALLRPVLAWPEVGCDLAAVDDVACMKLAAIAQRGARRDFVDVFAIGATSIPLGSMLDLYRAKYATRDVGHVLAALVWFEDAEREPMPAMLWKKDWDEIKQAIRSWVKSYAS